MRDPKRIKPFLAKLEQLWEANPDWRFCQMLINIGVTDGDDRLWFYDADERVEAKIDAAVRNGMAEPLSADVHVQAAQPVDIAPFCMDPDEFAEIRHQATLLSSDPNKHD